MPSRARPLPSRAKPAWDGTIHDLSAYRASPLEQLQRRQRYTSPHAQAAKREVRERRALLERSGGFEERLCELAQSAAEGEGDTTSRAIRQLDQAGPPCASIDLERARLR